MVMRCERCSAPLDGERCTVCSARCRPVCIHCQARVPWGSERCPVCGSQVLPGWSVTREELAEMGMHAFMPYTPEHNYDVYLGGNPDGGGYVFHNEVGYVGPMPETLALPGLIEDVPVYGIWNEFFCLGDQCAPDRYAETYRRMLPLKTIIVTNGVREAFTYAFFGCCGLETLVLPRTIQKMYYDFYDLFTDGRSPLLNGCRKSDVTVRYRGSPEEWERVAVTSRFQDYVRMGRIHMEFLRE